MYFFPPAIHFQGIEGGKGISEFPLLYYINAALWKAFGPSEELVRIINITIVFIGLTYLFKAIRLILSSSFWAILITLLIFSSPIFSFYTNGFMLNAPALALVFIGWYFFTKFYITSKNKFLNIAVWIFILAALFRFTMIIGFGFIYVVYFLELFPHYKFGKNGSKLFKKPLKHFLMLVTPFIVLVCWYLYAKYYNTLHHSEYFLSDIRPIWKAVNIHYAIAIKLYNDLLPALHSWIVIYGSILLLLAILFAYKKQHPLLFVATLTSSIGTIIYILLWYENLTVHDYYLLECLIFIAIVFITFLHHLKQNYVDLFSSKILKTICVLVLLANIYNCGLRTRIKYNNKDKFVKRSFIFSQQEIDYWNWYSWNYNNTTKAYETITPYLRSLGIFRTDFVISIPDQSPDITLYLMDQKGFTDLYFTNLQGKDRIDYFISKGAKYLIIGDTTYTLKDWLKPYLKNKIGTYQNILIYAL